MRPHLSLKRRSPAQLARLGALRRLSPPPRTLERRPQARPATSYPGCKRVRSPTPPACWKLTRLAKGVDRARPVWLVREPRKLRVLPAECYLCVSESDRPASGFRSGKLTAIFGSIHARIARDKGGPCG